MFDSPFQETDRPYQQAYGPGRGPRPGRCGGHGILRTVLFWTAVAVLAMIAFGTVTWAFGLVFHLIGLLVRVAIVTAVVAFVWRRVTRRHHRSYDA